MITYKFSIRSGRVNNLGLSPVILTVTINRMQAKKQLSQLCYAKEFNTQSQTLKNTPQNSSLNALISQLKAKCSKLIYELNFNPKPITASEFLNHVLEIKARPVEKNKLCFYTFFEQNIANRQVSAGREKHYQVLINQLKPFAPKLLLTDIDYTFCTNFFNHITVAYKNCNNTKIYKLKIIKLVLNEAFKMGVLHGPINLNYTIKKQSSQRIALSKQHLNELEQLHAQNKLSEPLQNTLTQFLFMCYTGLRYGDLKQFNTNLIKDGVIHLYQGKTSNIVTIPITDKAKTLLPENKFKVITNEKTNKNLKTIAQLTSINQISCHVARHTFATIALNSGISIDVVAEVLGHSSTQLTKVYAKMQTNYKIEQMKKWGV